MRQAPYAQAPTTHTIAPFSRASSGWESGGSGNKTKSSTQHRDFKPAELEAVGPGPGTHSRSASQADISFQPISYRPLSRGLPCRHNFWRSLTLGMSVKQMLVGVVKQAGHVKSSCGMDSLSSERGRA